MEVFLFVIGHLLLSPYFHWMLPQWGTIDFNDDATLTKPDDSRHGQSLSGSWTVNIFAQVST